MKLKKITKKIFKIIWYSFGGLILLWTLFWFVKMHTITDFGVIVTAILFAVGLYIFGIYIAITLLVLLIKWIIKKFKK